MKKDKKRWKRVPLLLFLDFLIFLLLCMKNKEPLLSPFYHHFCHLVLLSTVHQSNIGVTRKEKDVMQGRMCLFSCLLNEEMKNIIELLHFLVVMVFTICTLPSHTSVIFMGARE